MRFGFRFCLAMSDPHALRRVTAKRLKEWMRYEQVEPFGALRDNYHAGIVAKMVADVGRAKNSATNRPFVLGDFLLTYGESKEQKQSVEDQVRALNIWAAAMAQSPGE